MLTARLEAGTALVAVAGLDLEDAVLGKLARMNGADVDALAAHRALLGVTHGTLGVEANGVLGVALQRREQELATLGENAVHASRRRCRGPLERARDGVDAARVLVELLGDRARGGNGGVHGTQGVHALLAQAVDELLALEVMVLRVVEGALVHLDAHALGRELLGGADVLGKRVLARGVAAAVADAQRQVDGHVGIVRENGVPDLGGNASHAGKHDLVALWHAAKRARAGDIGVLERRGRANDAVIELARGDLERREALRGAGGGAQAALAARVRDLDAALGQVDGLHGTDVATQRAGVLVARLARDA